MVTDKRVNIVTGRVSAHEFDCGDIFCEKVDGEAKVCELETFSTNSWQPESGSGCAL